MGKVTQGESLQACDKNVSEKKNSKLKFLQDFVRWFGFASVLRPSLKIFI
jgi:hypothetical protein